MNCKYGMWEQKWTTINVRLCHWKMIQLIGRHKNQVPTSRGNHPEGEKSDKILKETKELT